jgi:hypothetical protein
MSKIRIHRLAAAAIVAASMLTLPMSAHANTNVNVPAVGTLIIGMVSGDGRPWAGFKPTGGGACSWWLLGTSSGLSNDISVYGTNSADVLIVAEGTSSMCGFTFTTVVLNGWRVFNHGNGGADWLSGRAAVHDGGIGNDFLVGTAGYTGLMWGSGGADKMWGGGRVNLYGEADNDTLCSTSNNNQVLFDGGIGTDTACGSYSSAWAVENLNTAACSTACNLF